MTDKLTYERGRGGTEQTVKLGGKVIGHIKLATPPKSGWQYFPKGDKQGGDAFATVDEVKRSLEEEPQ